MSIRKAVVPKSYRNKIWKFLCIVLIYCIILAILEGTVSHYVEDQHLIFGIYISWEAFFIALGSFGFGIIFLIVFRENIKKWV